MQKFKYTVSSGLSRYFSDSERIHHYTTAGGLYGILQSDCLWATHSNFLNDKTEFHVLDELPSGFLVSVAFPEFTRPSVIDALAEKIREIRGEARPDSYVFSAFVCDKGEREFSDGALSHWMSYSKSSGYALQLNPKKLWAAIERQLKLPAFQHAAVTFNKIVYLPKKVEEFSRDQIEALRSRLSVGPELLEIATEQNKINVWDAELSRFQYALLFANGFIKSDHFSHEREARIAVMLVPGIPDLPIYIYQRQSILVPYLKLFSGMLLKKGSALERIIVGPHPDAEKNRIALRLLLDNRGLSHIAVDISGIPYVG